MFPCLYITKQLTKTCIFFPDLYTKDVLRKGAKRDINSDMISTNVVFIYVKGLMVNLISV